MNSFNRCYLVVFKPQTTLFGKHVNHVMSRRYIILHGCEVRERTRYAIIDLPPPPTLPLTKVGIPNSQNMYSVYTLIKNTDKR